MAGQPPVIPVSQGVAPTNTPAGVALWSRGTEAVQVALAQKRPWTEMVDRSAFARPESLSDATSRIRKNLSYFRVNYAIILMVTIACSLLSHLVSLFVLLLLVAGWTYLYAVRTEPLVVFGRTYNEKEVLAIMSVFTVVVVLLTSVGSLIMSSAMIGALIIAAHGAFRVPDDLFLDDQEASGGFLSFLGSGASGIPPVVVSHV